MSGWEVKERRVVVLDEIPEPWALECVAARAPLEYVAEATNDQTGDKAWGYGETWTAAYADMVARIEGKG